MAGLMIGEVARQAGVAASALRYYEKAGLLPAPARAGKRRQYDPQILGRIRIILLARDAGFSVRETRTTSAASSAPIAKRNPKIRVCCRIAASC
jgi:MerR family redox-sensitive transcriptional activator SoxR